MMGVISTNREQRRAWKKNLKARGISETDATNIVALKQKLDSVPLIPEGAKVRLNMDVIMSDPDNEDNEPRWKQFVQDHKDAVFTVEYDKRHKENPTLVCFKEDKTRPKWLWWAGYLRMVR